MIKLTGEAVTDVMRYVLFKPEEVAARETQLPENIVLVEGLVRQFGYHRERLMEKKSVIDELLGQLPDNFDRDKGGGWSFLNACFDKDGNIWTGMELTMEELVCLGIGVGSASWIMKKMAAALPGGMPYFETHLKKEGVAS